MFESISDILFRDTYFGPLKTRKRAVEDDSPEEFTFESESHRLVGYLEVEHLACIDSHNWDLHWNVKLGSHLKILTNDVIFLFYWRFAIQEGKTITVPSYMLTCLPPLIPIYRRLYRRYESWPFDLITKCETIRTVNEQLRKFQPSSDLLILKSNLPRLLVEINSKPRPEDLIRMLLTGAAIIRLANKFLDTFTAKNFVLFAIYMGDNGKAIRYSLFQEPNNPVVCCTLYMAQFAS